MDNSNEIFNQKKLSIKQSSNNTKIKFRKEMKKHDVDIEKHLTRIQLDELYKLYEDSDIFNNSIKEKARRDISTDKADLNSLFSFLKGHFRKQLRDDLKHDSYTESIKSLAALNNIDINLKDPILNKYKNTLIESDKIDFSLFYFGNMTDIFTVIYNSFIDNQQTTTQLSTPYIDIIKEMYPGIEMNRLEYERYDSTLDFIRTCDKIDALPNDKDKKPEKDALINNIEDNLIIHYKTIFQVYYLNYLNFNYLDKKKQIHIKSNVLKEQTLKRITVYLEKIKKLLIKVINNDLKDFLISVDKKKYLLDIIKLEKHEYVSGFLLSTLYNFNKTEKYNIPQKYLHECLHWSTETEFDPRILQSPISDDNINKYMFYFDLNINKVIYIQNNIKMIEYQKKYQSQDKRDNIRLITTKEHLSNLQRYYNKHYKNIIIIIQKLIQKHEESQNNYLHVLGLFIAYDSEHHTYDKELEIKQELVKYLKSNNIQLNTSILINSRANFASIISNLNEQLLGLIKGNAGETSTINRYNRFISEYSLWVIHIMKYISNYPNESKQIIYLDKIRQMFITDNDIKKWYKSCVKNNLHYWLPVSYTGKGSYSFFLNIITNKKSYKIRPNDLIIVKYKNTSFKNSEDEITCWDNNNFNILLNEQFSVILTFIKKYVKSNKTLDMNDFNVIKSLVNRCNTQKSEHSKMLDKKHRLVKKAVGSGDDEILEIDKKLALTDEIEHDCKNLISYHQIIKEIIKSKYPYSINDNNMNNLNTTVKNYQTKLYNEYKTAKNINIVI
jgi:hypothetical protein